MQQSAVHALVSNAAMLVFLSIIFELTYYIFPRSRVKSVVNGVLVALTGIAIMSMSFELLPGVIFDTRSIIISMTALLFEPVTTLIAVAGTIAFRIYQGGAGVLTGVIVILVSAMIGLIWRQWNSKEYRLRWFNVYMMGLFVHLAMIASMSLLPYPDNISVVEDIAAPVMIIYPIATVLLYLLLTKQQTFRKMRGELQQSEERFRLLFDKAPLAYQSLDADGRIVDVNGRWLDTFGYEADEVIGRYFCDFLDPAYRDGYRQGYGSFKEHGTIHRELEIIHKSGRRMIISYDGSIVRDASGRFKQAYCILRDITEQKRAETEVRQSERKLRQLFENMSQGVVCQTADGQVISANPKAQEILGLTLEEMLGKTSESPVWRTIREDGSELPGWDHPSMVALRTGKPVGPVVLGVYNPVLGSHVWLSVNATPIYDADENMSHVYTVFQDVTAEKKARHDYELLFTSMVDGFALHEVICDEEGKPVDYRFLAVNPAFEQIVGMKAPELVGKTVREAMPGIEEYWIETYGKVALTGHSERFEHYDTITGKHYRVMAYQPAPMQFACTFSDDTSRVLAEEKSMRTLARLRGLLENSNSLIIVFTDKGVVVEASAAVANLVGVRRGEMGGMSMHKLGLFGILAKARRLSDYIAAGREFDDVDVFEFVINGEKRYYESRLFPIETPDKSETLFGYLGIDVTERMMAERALKASEEKYSNYIENAPYAVFVLDENGNFLESNKAASDMTGYEKDKLLRMNIWDISAEEMLDETARHFRKLLVTGQMSAELKYFHRDGHIRWWKVDAVQISDGRFLTFSIDITDRKNAEAELINLNKRDYLTGVYNRRFFEAELERMDQEKLYPLSIILGDINGVKFINDAFGHAEGDKFIRDTALILKSCCRECDVLARTGGDEFAILLPQTDNETAAEIMRRIQKALADFDEENAGDIYQHSVSLGLATKHSEQESLKDILKLAEGYMYQRKLLEHSSVHSTIVASIKATMFEKSHETEEHAQRLVSLSKAVGVAMGLPQEELDKLELLASLHDIGKVGIRDEILTKPAELTDMEWAEMKRHPEIGYRIAKTTQELAPIAEGILHHHEWWDGSGYPHGLAGEEIPLISRIIAIVDAYDAMTNDRPYRKAMSHLDAIERIGRNAGTQFDPDIARIFTEMFSDLSWLDGMAL